MDLGDYNLLKEPIGRVMAKISHMFLADLNNNLLNLDISRSFYPLLIIESGGGLMNQQELAQKLAIDKVQVVRIVDYLSSKGYVQRKRDTNDRRKYNLVVTEKAQQYLPEIKKAIQLASGKAFHNIPQSKVEELYDLLRIMKNNLDKTNDL